MVKLIENRRFSPVIEPIRRSRPSQRNGSHKLRFNFIVREDRIHHEVRFIGTKGVRFNENDDPRLLKRWLFVSERRILTGQLDHVYKEGEMDTFLFKNPFGLFFDLERLKGETVPFDQLKPDELYANLIVMEPYGRLLMA